jgi:hypothetical protein
MGRRYVDVLLGRGIDPTAGDTAAWKHQGVHLTLDDGEFEVAIERRAGYRFPHRSGWKDHRKADALI